MESYQDKDWKLLLDLPSLPELQHLAKLLEDAGIETYIMDAQDSFAPSLSIFRLFVREGDWDRAQEIARDNQR